MSTWIEQHNNTIPFINTYMHSKRERQREREREREIEYNHWTQVCSIERYTKPIQSSYLHSTQYYASSEITHVCSFWREWSTTSKYPLHKPLETPITSMHTHCIRQLKNITWPQWVLLWIMCIPFSVHAHISKETLNAPHEFLHVCSSYMNAFRY